MAKKTPRQRAERRADDWFSRFIRLRDADENGICKCCTCNRRGHFLTMEAGHYVTRTRRGTRYDERNTTTQESYCNRWGHGEKEKHAKYINEKYGAGQAEALRIKAELTCKRATLEITMIAMHYKAETLRLLDEKGFERPVSWR